MKERFSVLVVFGVLAILIVSGCTQQQVVQPTPAQQTPAEQPAVGQPAVKLSAGNYLVDDKGNTLYLFTRDVAGDSKCTGGCLNSWPTFYQEQQVAEENTPFKPMIPPIRAADNI